MNDTASNVFLWNQQRLVAALAARRFRDADRYRANCERMERALDWA